MTLKQALALDHALGGVATEGTGMNKSQEGSGRKLGRKKQTQIKMEKQKKTAVIKTNEVKGRERIGQQYHKEKKSK